MADERPFIKLVNTMPEHPKVDGLSDAAFRLLIETWCYCSRLTTDGFVPTVTWMKRSKKSARDELIAAGLAEESDGGVVMHDYLDHQRSAADVADLKEKRRLAGSLGGQAKAANRVASAKPVGKQSAKQKASNPPSKSVPDIEVDKERDLQPPSVSAGEGAGLSITQRSKRLVDAYAEAEPMCKWPAVNGIVIRAIKAEKWSDLEIGEALMRLAKEGRGVTIETLRTELAGFVPRNGIAVNGHKPSTTDQRVAAGMELSRKYAEMDGS